MAAATVKADTTQGAPVQPQVPAAPVPRPAEDRAERLARLSSANAAGG